MSVRDHYTRAAQLSRMAKAHAVARSGDPDWSVVYFFYSALHLAQAFLLSKGATVIPDDHMSRANALRSFKPPLDKRCLDAYFFLKRMSENVRYTAGYVLIPSNKSAVERNHACVAAWLEAEVRSALGLGLGTDL